MVHLFVKQRKYSSELYPITISYLVLIDVFSRLWLNAQRVKCYNRSCTPSRKPPWDTLFFLFFIHKKNHYTIKNNKISSPKSLRPRCNYLSLVYWYIVSAQAYCITLVFIYFHTQVFVKFFTYYLVLCIRVTLIWLFTQFNIQTYQFFSFFMV